MKNPHCHCGSNELRVSLFPFAPDERLGRVHAILESLHEGRFGPHQYQRYLDEPDYRWPDRLVRGSIFDLMPSGPRPLPGEKRRRGLLPNCTGRGSVASVNAGPATWDVNLSAAQGASPHRSPPTLARGSPQDEMPVRKDKSAGQYNPFDLLKLRMPTADS